MRLIIGLVVLGLIVSIAVYLFQIVLFVCMAVFSVVCQIINAVFQYIKGGFHKTQSGEENGQIVDNDCYSDSGSCLPK